VDDDTVIQAAVHPNPRRGIRLIGGGRCFDQWFFQDRATALKWARWAPLDAIGEHAALLGRRVSSLVRASPSVLLEEICCHFAEPGRSARIVGTMAGKVGDSGRHDPVWDIWAGYWTENRAPLGRLEVAEISDSVVIGHDIGCMATAFALDLRSALPPFFPKLGGEDGMFAAILSRVLPEAYWGVVPHAIIHDRPPRGIEEQPPWLGANEALRAQLLALPARRCGRSDEEAIQDAGSDLTRAVTSAGIGELRQRTLECLGRFVSQWLDHFRRVKDCEIPDAQRARLEGAERQLVLEFIRLCAPGSESPSAAFNWSDFGCQLTDYGRLLQYWPTLFDAARDLRSQGVRLSVGFHDSR